MKTIKPAVANVAHQEYTYRVIRHENGKYYPQQHIIGTNGLDWYYFPEYKGYKTERGATNALPERF